MNPSFCNFSPLNRKQVPSLSKFFLFTYILVLIWVAQLVECRTQDPKDPGSNPVTVRSTRNICEFFWVQNVVLTHCQCAQPNPCVYTHSQKWSCTHVKDPVVHVRIRWISETRRDSACALLTGGLMYCCTVNENRKVTICTLSSAHWQQASNLSALRHFELIWNKQRKQTKSEFSIQIL